MKKTDIFLSSLLVVISSISCFAQNLVPMPIPDRLIKHDLYFSENQTYSSFNNIQSGNYDGNNPSDIIIEIDADVNFTAGSSIIISEETDVSILSDEAQAIFEIKPNEISGAWFAPQYPGEVPKYNKLELGFNLDQFEGLVQNFKNHLEPSLNPFDPDEMDCYMIFTKPSGSQKRVNSFYYEQFSVASNEWQQEESAYPWRVRFAPDKIGQWTCQFHAEVNGEHFTSETINFECTESMTSGYLETDGRYLAYEEGGGPFFTRGHNLYSSGFGYQRPSDWQFYKDAFHELADAQGNFTRIELGVQNALPYWKPELSESPELPEHDNYFLKMDQMWEYDQVIEICDLRQIYFIMFRHHVEIEGDASDPWDGISWQKNPMKVAFELNDRHEFFANSDAKIWQENCLRYVFARWGYTPKFAFHSYSEIDNWVSGFNMPTSPDDDFGRIIHMFDFVEDQKDYITQDLGQDRMMFTHSYANIPDFESDGGLLGGGELNGLTFDMFFASDDLISFHKYYIDKAYNWKARYNKFKNLRHDFPNKPILLEESGFSLGGCKPGWDNDFDGIIETPIDCNDDGDFTNDDSDYNNWGRVMNCTSIDLKNAIWGSSMMGGIGTSMDYFWTFVHASPGGLDYYGAVDIFFNDENLGAWDYEMNRDKKSSGSIFGTPGPLHNCDLEWYYLSSNNQERVLGWVHNSSHYWRNYTHLPCMDQILFNDAVVDDPGFTADGNPIDNYPLDYNFDQERYRDKHSPSGTDSYSGSFNVSGLRASGLGGLEIYDLEIYNTTTGDLIDFGDSEVTTSVNGVAEIQVPPMDNQNPDYAFKVIFNRTEPLSSNWSQEDIEEFIAEESNIDRNGNIINDISNSPIDSQLELHPNPTSGSIILKGVQEGVAVKIVNSFGEEVNVDSRWEMETLTFEVGDLSSGVYYVLVEQHNPVSLRFIKL